VRRLLLVALVVFACGRKAPPVAPETVRPEAPDNLTATVAADGVLLGWDRPVRYSGGQRMNDLGSFDIQRAAADEASPRFLKVGTFEVEDRLRFRKERHLEWTDKTVEPGQRYLYRVIAVTLDRYRSAPAGPVAVRVPAAR